jgi:hypothetical protein
LGDRCFLFLDLALLFLDCSVLFEELVEQHRIHGVVAHGVDLALGVAHHQVRVHLGYLFGNQTELRRACCVALVVKRHWLEREDGFAGLIHRFNLFLEPARRTGRAELPDCVYQDWYSRVYGCDPANAGDECSRLVTVADANRVGLASNPTIADIDIKISGGEIVTGANAQCDVLASSGVVKEGVITGGRVIHTGGVVNERLKSVGCVIAAGSVESERTSPGSRVILAGGIVKERSSSGGRVLWPSRVAKKRFKPSGRVRAADGVAKERFKPGRRVIGAGGVEKERIKPGGGVIGASGVAFERLGTGGGVKAARGVEKERNPAAVLCMPLLRLWSAF